MADPRPPYKTAAPPEWRDGCLLLIVAVVFSVMGWAAGVAADRTIADFGRLETTRALDALQAVCCAAALVVGFWGLLKLYSSDRRHR